MESFLVVLSEYTKKNEHLNPVFQEILSLELESPDWSLKLITELLTRGADVNFRNKYVLETPIETSLRNADPRLMNLLIGLGGGFDFGKNNNEVLKPLLLILNNPKLWTDKKPDIKKCFDIFIENAPKDSPLDYALAKEVCDIIFTKDYLFIEFAEPLFQYIGTQKDPDTKNNFFHQAVMEGDSDLAMDILEYGLCIDLISQPNSAKKTPLMLALENDHLGLAKKMFSSLDVVGQIKALNELTFDGKKEAGEELLDIIFDNMEKTSKSKNPPSTSFMLKKREALTNKDLKKALDKHLETIPEAVTKIRGKIKTLEKNNSQCTIS
jgi:ankyrin repeat protein